MNSSFQHHVSSPRHPVPPDRFTVSGPRRPLSNDIHSIWRRENFLNLDFHAHRNLIGLNHAAGIFDDPNVRMSLLAYQQFEPALRLATMLLARARPVMMRILFAPVSSDGSYLTNDYRITRRQHMQYDQTLIEISSYLNIFHFNPSHPEIGNSIYALTSSVPPPRYLPDKRCVMAIATQYGDTITSPSFVRRPVSSRLSLYLNLAALLVHEFAHALWKHRFYDYIFQYRMNTGGREPMEPSLFPPEQGTVLIRELGEAVEKFLFGGRVQLTTNAISRMDRPHPVWTGKRGVCIAVQQLPSTHGAVQVKGLWLTRETIMNMFDARFWSFGASTFGDHDDTLWPSQRECLDLVVSEYPWKDVDVAM